MALSITGGSAWAKAPACRIPPQLTIPSIAVPRGEPSNRGEIGGYVLAISWSPEFCRLRKDDSRHRGQCGPGTEFGFVLHGLWPEGEGGRRDPAWCQSKGHVTASLARQNYCRTPSAWLMAHEWAKHGTCMAKRPETYFKVAGVLFDSLSWPDMNALSRRNPSGRDVLKTIASANPSFPRSSFALDVNTRGWLEEVLVCYDTTFHPVKCEASRGRVPAGPVKIWRGR
jgi:ribonuclease T2